MTTRAIISLGAVAFAFSAQAQVSDAPVVITLVPAASPPTPSPSPSGTIITPGNGSFVDASLNTYGITTAGAVTENGNPLAGGGGTGEGEYYNGLPYFEDATTKTWYTWTGTEFYTAPTLPPTPTPPTPTPPTPTPPTPTPPTPTPPTPTPPSPDKTVVLAGSGGSIIDAAGNAWTISTGNEILENGKAPAFSANVAEMAYVSGTIFQENTGNQWYSWNGIDWLGGPNPFATLVCVTQDPAKGQFQCTYSTP